MNMITQAFETFLRSLRTVLISGPDVDFGRKAEQILAASNTLLTDLLPGLFQELGQAIFEDTQRREEWEAVRKDQRVLLTAFGELRFERRYYRHKETGEMAYLLDRYTRIQAKARVNGDVRQKAVTLSAQGSYSKSAAASSPVPISRMSVCNDVSDLERFPSLNADGEKRSVKHLYVEADEDHVSLQNGQKTQVKLVYVHEGAEERNGRRALIAPRYLAWPSGGDNDLLWETVSKYIGQQYVPGDIQHIFLSGDCASWIRKGEEWLYPCVPVMDSFHTLKALRELCGGKQERVNAFLHYAREDEFLKARELCLGILREGPKPQREAKRRQANYLLGNWQRIVNQRHPGAQGCSAEGHVSHILPERLSSRPLGWSMRNMENIAQLRVMKANGQVICYEDLKKTGPGLQSAVGSSRSAALLDSARLQKPLKKRTQSTLNSTIQTLPVLMNGAKSPLYQALHGLCFDSAAC